ncbi:MAG: hypothetical protein P8Y70_18495 [Candidatus Lokiarchaeota archaeon]
MSQSTTYVRCPRCGNENKADYFACTFCGKRLRIETIEKVPMFKRIEKEWYAPYPFYLKILYLIIKPNLAFWDINHKRTKSPGYLILLFSSLLYGLLGLGFLACFRIQNIGNAAAFMYGLGFYIVFFLFGLLYQALLFFFLTWIFTKGANITVDFSDRLESRFETKEEEGKYREEDLSPFSIYKGGVLLQKQEAKKYKMLYCAFAPFLLTNGIKVIIVALFSAGISITVNPSTTPIPNAVFTFLSTSWILPILDIIDGLTIAIWIPMLITLGIRELSNSSTTRVLLPSLVIGVIIAVLFYFIRPSILNLIL